MRRRTHRSNPYLEVVTGVVVLALAYFAGSDGVSIADESGLPAEARLEQSMKRPATSGSVETGSAKGRETAGAVDRDRTKRGRALTTQQKRIFVLGIGAVEKE